jgi:hypothetical protein
MKTGKVYQGTEQIRERERERDRQTRQRDRELGREGDNVGGERKQRGLILTVEINT